MYVWWLPPLSFHSCFYVFLCLMWWSSPCQRAGTGLTVCTVPFLTCLLHFVSHYSGAWIRAQADKLFKRPSSCVKITLD
jgi:hypothetical protein